MFEALPCLNTLTRMAELSRCKPHRVRYILEQYKIRPCGKAGNTNIYTNSDVAFVLAQLKRMDLTRAGAV